MAATKRSAKETWDAITRQAEADEIDRFLAKTPAEVDASLRAHGHDPAAIRAEGEALAKKLRADREELAWQVEAAKALARERARFEGRAKRYTGLSRGELLARIAVAKRDPRFTQPVTVMFRNRKTEEASEDELRAILGEIEALAERE